MRNGCALLLGAASILVGGFSADAQEHPEPKWAEISAGCKFLDRFPTAETRYSWTGACVDGYVSGEGVVTMTGPMNWSFDGLFKEGRLIQGKLKFPAGEYSGGLKDNLSDGPGAYRYTNGTVVEATFVQGVPKGDGTITYPEGSKYVGPLSRRYEPHGKGRYTYASGTVYVGDFVEGVEQGKGVLTYADGGSYTGDFLAGERSGEGEMLYADGARYVGQFRAGKKQGRGTERGANGAEYVGDFVLDLRHGNGRFVTADGDILEGEWKSDQLNGKCSIFRSVEDSQYSGSCVKGYQHGHGVLTAPGFSYDGEFIRGVSEGKGTLRLTAENRTTVYEGGFKGGLMHGEGTLKSEHATIQGEFRAGALYKGTIKTQSGREFAVDTEHDTLLEILPDGSRRPASPVDLRDLTV